MVDRLTPEQRSDLMRAIKSFDTVPETLVRLSLDAMGVRHTAHAADLPGRPDVVMRRRKKAIFVNGCFWHGHVCRGGRIPKTNTAWWRDKADLRALRRLGWSVAVVWECETRNPERLRKRLARFIRRRRPLVIG
jgi:DNA mismatch endonuclease (patch repair protein)